MATVTQPAPTPVDSPPRHLYRFTVKQYHRLIEAGILTPDDHVELLDGWVVKKMTRNPPHDSAISRINRRLTRLLPDEWVLRVQSAITLTGYEPEPDFAIVQGPEDRYSRRKPGARDVVLVSEVADTSLLEDRQTKGPIYAQARIAEYWIVNLGESQVEVYTQPKGGKAPAYRQRRDYPADQAVPLVLDGKEVARLPVQELLPG